MLFVHHYVSHDLVFKSKLVFLSNMLLGVVFFNWTVIFPSIPCTKTFCCLLTEIKILNEDRKQNPCMEVSCEYFF